MDIYMVYLCGVLLPALHYIYCYFSVNDSCTISTCYKYMYMLVFMSLKQHQNQINALFVLCLRLFKKLAKANVQRAISVTVHHLTNWNILCGSLVVNIGELCCIPRSLLMFLFLCLSRIYLSIQAKMAKNNLKRRLKDEGVKWARVHTSNSQFCTSKSFEKAFYH